MKVTELIGPPGAGKTTYASRLMSPSVYAGNEGRARCLFGHTLGKVTNGIFPPQIQDAIIRKTFRQIEVHYISKFFTKYPSTLETIKAIVQYYDDSENVLEFMLSEAAWYEFHSKMLSKEETYIIDDGLYQFHLRLLSINGWNETDIVASLPEPDKLIIIDAPAETCLKRQEQRARGRTTQLEGVDRESAIELLNQYRDRAKAVASKAKDHGIHVEFVENG